MSQLASPTLPPSISSAGDGDSLGSEEPQSNTSPTDLGRPIHRVTLACLPCRSRHVKCNAAKPKCSRCIADDVPCTYAQSRRRGHRRSKIPPADVVPFKVNSQPVVSRSLPSPVSSTPASFKNSNSFGYSEPLDSLSSFPIGLCDTAGVDDNLISVYYTYFHPDHPFLPPRWALTKYYASDPALWTPVALAMQFTSSMFNSAHPTEELRQLVEDALAPLLSGGNTPACPFLLQAAFLYGITVLWCDEMEHGFEVLRKVMRLAMDLGMHLESYAKQNGRGDPVLEESWRRFWWMIYLAEGHVAGATHIFPTYAWDVKKTATLPCEDDEYESGNVPTPRKLEDYDMREFLPEDDPGFSSFAHLVGLANSLETITCRNLPLEKSIVEICSQTDLALSAWCSLLPTTKRHCLTSKREVDRHLFKANMLINTYIADLHRQLSELEYSSIEAVSRCGAPPPSPAVRNADKATTHLHTRKALLAIRRMGDLIPLPTNILTHTPFLICMIANTMVAHLAACRYLFRGAALQLERERVRASMGALRVYGEVWPLGKRTYREMGIIAREILCLTDKDIPRLEPREPEPKPVVTQEEVADVSWDVATAFFDFQNLPGDFFTSFDPCLPLEEA